MFFTRSTMRGILVLFLSSTVAIAAPHFLLRPSVAQMSEQNPISELGQVELIQLLNLTPEQYRVLETNFNKNKDQIQQRQQALLQRLEEIHKLIDGTATSDQIRQKYKQIQELHSSLQNISLESVLALREVLNSEQRQKLSALIQKQMDNFRNQVEEPNEGNYLEQELEIRSVSSSRSQQCDYL